MGLYDDELKEIQRKSQVVYSKKGIFPFLAGLDGCHLFDLYQGLGDISIESVDELEDFDE